MTDYKQFADLLDACRVWADNAIAAGAPPDQVLAQFADLTWNLAGLARLCHDLEARSSPPSDR